MNNCACCGQELQQKQQQMKCGVPRCKEDAEFEGWYRVRNDVGRPTDTVRKLFACAEHRNWFIGS